MGTNSSNVGYENFAIVENFNVRYENFEIIENSNVELINQLCKKIKLIQEFKDYINNSDGSSIYHKNIIGTLEYIRDESATNIQVILICKNSFFASLFGPLYTIPVYNHNFNYYDEILNF